jgi:hypothetical protein
VAAEQQFAGIFTMADQASIDGQRRQMLMLRLELGAVLLGAFLGAIDGRTSRVISGVAFVLAIVSVALGVLYTLLFRFAIIRLSYDVHLGAGLIGAYNLVGQSLLFLVYATTLVLGILGARGTRRLQAGVAIGVGGAGVVGILFALMTNLISAAL